LFGINFWFLAGMGKVKQRAKITFFALMINILLNIILIKLIWIIWAVIAMMMSRIILFYLSYKLVNKNENNIFNRKYLLKNIILISIICGVLYYMKDIFFVMKDSYRYKNLWYLILITCIYYIYILAFNYKNIIIIKREFKNSMNFKT
jgi:O-antigen/teichoic acid export membrane protein